MKLFSLNELLHDQLKDLYSAESQLIKALPRMVKNASSARLREAFQSHLEETRGQLDRLQTIGENLGLKLTGKKCKAMEGLVEEGKEVLEAEGEDAVLDAALIAAAQRVEHYEISAYGSARAAAEQLGNEEVVALLQETLEEEAAADEKLSRISEGEIFPRIASLPRGESLTGVGFFFAFAVYSAAETSSARAPDDRSPEEDVPG